MTLYFWTVLLFVSEPTKTLLKPCSTHHLRSSTSQLTYKWMHDALPAQIPRWGGWDRPWISVSDLSWLTLPYWTHPPSLSILSMCVCVCFVEFVWVLIPGYQEFSLFPPLSQIGLKVIEKPVTLLWFHNKSRVFFRNITELLSWEIYVYEELTAKLKQKKKHTICINYLF